MVLVVMYRFRSRTDFPFSLLKTVAERIQGMELSPRGFSSSWYRVTMKSGRARLQWDVSRLLIEFQFDHKVPTFAIRPKGRGGVHINVWSGKSIETGDKDFDHHFVLKSIEDSFSESFLRSKLPELVRGLALFRRDTAFGISMGGTSGRITLLKPTYNRHRMVKFLWHSFCLSEHLLEWPSLSKGDTNADSGIRICPICGMGMEEDAEPCPKCDRQQHRSCWQYAENCSDWDCTGKWTS